MATEPIQALPYPSPSDAPDGPNQIKALADAVVTRTVMRFASTSARDVAVTSPVEGMIAVTGTGATLQTWQYRSAAWSDITVRPWAAFTPVLTASTTNPTGYTAAGRWCQIGKLVRYVFTVTAGGGFTPGSGTYSLSLPTDAATTLLLTAGSARLYDSSTGNAHVGVRVAVATSTTLQLQTVLAFGGNLTNVVHSIPWTWASSDIIDGYIDYEAA